MTAPTFRKEKGKPSEVTNKFYFWRLGQDQNVPKNNMGQEIRSSAKGGGANWIYCSRERGEGFSGGYRSSVQHKSTVDLVPFHFPNLIFGTTEEEWGNKGRVGCTGMN